MSQIICMISSSALVRYWFFANLLIFGKVWLKSFSKTGFQAEKFI
jgi:hypothetical protein